MMESKQTSASHKIRCAKPWKLREEIVKKRVRDTNYRLWYFQTGMPFKPEGFQKETYSRTWTADETLVNPVTLVKM